MSMRWIRPIARHWLLSRRRFLGGVGAVGAAALVGCKSRTSSQEHGASAPDGAPKAAKENPPSRVSLSEGEWALIAAITHRILPSDDGPGAKEAQVIRFIDRELATPQVKPLAPAVKEFVASLSRWRTRHGKSFLELDPAAQDRALATLAEGRLDLDFDQQAELFEFLHTLTLEGFLSDPSHGGNHDGVGWRYIAFAPGEMNHVGGHPHE